MSTSRPAFPQSLPPKTNYFATQPRHVASPATSEFNGIVKVILALLVVATLGNLALTLYLNRARETAVIGETAVKENQLIEEMTRIRSELAHSRVALANSAAEIGRMKVAYATVIAQIGAVTSPQPSRYKTGTTPSATGDGTTAETLPAAVPPGEHAK